MASELLKRSGRFGPDRIVHRGRVFSTEFTLSFTLIKPASSVKAFVTLDSDRSRVLIETDDVAATQRERRTGFYVYQGQIRVEGLSPRTKYYFWLEIDGIANQYRGYVVETFPIPGEPAAYRVGIYACSRVTARTRVEIMLPLAAEDCLFDIHAGDMTYADVYQDDERLQRQQVDFTYYANFFAQEVHRVRTLIRVCSDHDGGGKGSFNASSPDGFDATHFACIQNSNTVMKQFLPMYDTPDASVTTQRFDVGNDRWNILDMRSMKDPSKFTILGNEDSEFNGKQDLMDAYVQAHDDDIRLFPLVWPDMLHAANAGDGYRAAPYIDELYEIFGFLQDTAGPPIVIYYGDHHGRSIDMDTFCKTYLGTPKLRAPVWNCAGVYAESPHNSVPMTVNGRNTAAGLNKHSYSLFETTADEDPTITITIKGDPVDLEANEATVLVTASTSEVPASVEFTTPVVAGLGEDPILIPVRKNGCGPFRILETVNDSSWSVDWATTGPSPQTGTLYGWGNVDAYEISVNGTTTSVTLSNPVNITLGALLTTDIDPDGEDEFAAFIAELDVTPEIAVQIRLNSVFKQLKDAGIYTDIYDLFLPSIGDSSDASDSLINLVDPTGTRFTTTGSPLLVTGGGYIGNGGSSRVRLRPLSGMAGSQDNSAISVFVLNSINENTPDVANANMQISTISASNNNIRTALNNGTVDQANNSSSTAIGFTTIARLSATGYSVYKNGTLMKTVAATSETVDTGEINVLGGPTGDGNTKLVGAVVVWKNFTAAKEAALYNILNQWFAGQAWTIPDVPLDYADEAVAWFDAMANEQDTAFKNAANTMIEDLIGIGYWQETSVMYILASPDEDAACLNAYEPSVRRMIPEGGATFTADEGYTGDATDAHLHAGFSLSDLTKYAKDNARISAWVLTNTARTTWVVGNTAGVSANLARIAPRTSSNFFASRINDNTTSNIANSDSRGFWTIQREGSSTQYKVYHNGSLFGTVTATSTDVPDGEFCILREGSSYDNRQVAIVVVGASVSADIEAAAYTIIETFLTARGAI